uniref:Uncharacterized protein n=1 Tax=Arundo donax TaxID=35708 RepID=A0A0A9FLA5_ARUDO
MDEGHQAPTQSLRPSVAHLVVGETTTHIHAGVEQVDGYGHH